MKTFVVRERLKKKTNCIFDTLFYQKLAFGAGLFVKKIKSDQNSFLYEKLIFKETFAIEILWSNCNFEIPQR